MSRYKAVGWMVGVTGILVGVTLVGVTLVVTHWVKPKTSCRFPIRYVRFEGQLQHLRPSELEKLLKPLLEDGYFGLDLSRLAAAIKQLPWVDEVQVERIWPDVLRVRIREQVPYLRWGKTALLNPRGDKFTPEMTEDVADLPQLEGPEGHEQQLFAAYGDMAAALAGLQLKIRRLEVDARRSWQLTLAPAAQPDGKRHCERSEATGMVVVLGRKQPQDVFARVVRSLARLSAEQRRRIQRLDARYEHGFAVQWRPPLQRHCDREPKAWREAKGKPMQAKRYG